MTHYYSLDDNEQKIFRDPNQGNLYNLDTRTVINNFPFTDSLISTYIVKNEEEMRFDLVCKSVYGSDTFEEELMDFNGILNTYRVKSGQVIKYIPPENMNYLHGTDPTSANANKSLVNKNKNTKLDPARQTNQGLPPTVKPSGLEQMQVDEVNAVIRIINNMG